MVYRGRGPSWTILGICSPAPKIDALLLEEHTHLLLEFRPEKRFAKPLFILRSELSAIRKLKEMAARALEMHCGVILPTRCESGRHLRSVARHWAKS
jgi:hypothetical protein